MAELSYRGRFAPSPTGPLHLGSLAAALASWLDARAHGGQWLVRIEDADHTRCRAEHRHTILTQLQAFGLLSDAPVLLQSDRSHRYQQVLDELRAADLAYPCACTRSEVESLSEPAAPGLPSVYAGTCRAGLRGRPARAWRARVAEASVESDGRWSDRRLGRQLQDVPTVVGDFVLRRADGVWAYQLAVVVDDADQGITHVVRGEDLADNTPRQRFLQRVLGLPTVHYLHAPLLLAADGHKLSKQNGAEALDPEQPWDALQIVAPVLGLRPPDRDSRMRVSRGQALHEWLHRCTQEWRSRWC